MRNRSTSPFSVLLRTAAVLVLVGALAACSSDDEGTGNAADADQDAPSDPVGTLTFAGASYELTRSDCEVGAEGLSRWFAFDAEGDVELAVYEGEVGSVSLLVRDDHPEGPSWEQTEDPSLIEVDGDAAAVSGSATVSPAALGVDEPADVSETVEFDFTC